MITNKTFAIERGEKFIDGVMITDNNGEYRFEQLMEMSTEEMENNQDIIEEFIFSSIEAVNELWEDSNEDIVITLINEDNLFIWSIVIHFSEQEEDDDEVQYQIYDWLKEGKQFRYAEDK